MGSWAVEESNDNSCNAHTNDDGPERRRRRRRRRRSELPPYEEEGTMGRGRKCLAPPPPPPKEKEEAEAEWTKKRNEPRKKIGTTPHRPRSVPSLLPCPSPPPLRRILIHPTLPCLPAPRSPFQGRFPSTKGLLTCEECTRESHDDEDKMLQKRRRRRRKRGGWWKRGLWKKRKMQTNVCGIPPSFLFLPT